MTTVYGTLAGPHKIIGLNKPQTFTVETRGAGQSDLGLSVVGSTEPKIGCVDKHDGTLTVKYLPNSIGNYDDIAVSSTDQPVPGLLTLLHCCIKHWLQQYMLC